MTAGLAAGAAAGADSEASRLQADSANTRGSSNSRARRMRLRGARMARRSLSRKQCWDSSPRHPRPQPTNLLRMRLLSRKPLDAAPSSGLPPVVDRHDPARKIAIARAPEARRLQHRPEFILRRMLPDRLGQIAVAVLVAGEQPAQPRQHLERMEIVERPEPVGLH